MEELKIACVGAGNSGISHMVLFEKYLPGCIKAYSDLSSLHFNNHFQENNYDFLRNDFKDIPYYINAEEMICSCEINTLIISTYCVDHFNYVKLAVKYKLNILLEKPIAINERDIEECYELLKDYPKIVSVNFTMKAAPVSLAAKENIKNGVIGGIVSVQYVNNVHYGDEYFRKWMRTKGKVGDLFLQKATHDFDIINSIIGLKPLRISAFGSRKVYGGEKPDSLKCDGCDEKYSCSMSVYYLNRASGKSIPPEHMRYCVYANEIDIDDNHTVIIQYEDGVTVSYSQVFNVPTQSTKRGGVFIGTKGVMELNYYNKFIETYDHKELICNSKIKITKLDQKPGSVKEDVFDWAGNSHFDGTENGILEKIKLLSGENAEVKNSIREGYISAKMCIAAQESIEKKQTVEINLNL